MATKNTDNWIQIEWIGGKFDGIIYDINIRSVVEKPPFKIGQEVTLCKINGSRPGQKGRIVKAPHKRYVKNKGKPENVEKEISYHKDKVRTVAKKRKPGNEENEINNQYQKDSFLVAKKIKLIQKRDIPKVLSIASGPTTERPESVEPLTIDSEKDAIADMKDAILYDQLYETKKEIATKMNSEVSKLMELDTDLQSKQKTILKKQEEITCIPSHEISQTLLITPIQGHVFSSEAFSPHQQDTYASTAGMLQYYTDDSEIGKVLKAVNPTPTRTKFARELVKRKLPAHLRAISTCSGTLGKHPIAMDLLKTVEMKSFAHFQLKEGEEKNVSWQACKDAINEWWIRANRKMRI